jgi:hypothetical protein
MATFSAALHFLIMGLELVFDSNIFDFLAGFVATFSTNYRISENNF